ncbi:hypothetical protein Ciccas_000051 [Cichlidogyrus casuarinus]|uniref:G-protein coupled receptors family 1 profile domain-containing protein n=1 Tax=Cichlidogyrus casuarinus TaxID=1844966 RepID=A0ABD2QPA0_9PLAT
MVGFRPKYGMPHLIATVIVLGLMILITIVGNVLVVAAILLERNLRNVSNYLIVSLAIADLMVATFVMPISALREVSSTWWLGDSLCDVWVIADVLCCTASILHLVGVAIDRYWAVTQVDYIRRRSAKRIFIMIGIIWLLSIVISIPSRFDLRRILNATAMNLCEINGDPTYTLFSTVFAFYMPMLFMIGIYLRIYRTAMARIRKTAFQKHKNAQVSRSSANTQSVTSENKLYNTLSRCACSFCGRSSHSELSPKEPDFTVIAIETKANKIEKSQPANECQLKLSSLDTTCELLGSTEDLLVQNRDSEHELICPTQSQSRGNSLVASSENASQRSSRKRRQIHDSVKSERRRTAHFLGASSKVSDKSPISQSSLEKTGTEKQGSQGRLAQFVQNHRQSLATVAAGTVTTVAMCSSLGSKTPSTDEIAKLGNGSVIGIENQDDSDEERSSFDAGKSMMNVSSQLKPTIFGVTMACAAAAQIARDRVEQAREKKAALTLAIITGCFLLCWIPFFIVALVRPFHHTSIDAQLGYWMSLFLWLGYVNSMLNPVIYTIFSPDFRNAFRKILFGKYNRNRNQRKGFPRPNSS